METNKTLLGLLDKTYLQAAIYILTFWVDKENYFSVGNNILI